LIEAIRSALGPAGVNAAPVPEPIHTDSLLRRCQGKPALAERLLGKFEQQLAGMVDSLRQGLDRRDGATLAAPSPIKGAAATCPPARVRGGPRSWNASARRRSSTPPRHRSSVREQARRCRDSFRPPWSRCARLWCRRNLWSPLPVRREKRAELATAREPG